MAEHHAEIGPAHPAMAGHFPGQPIVPGVLILGAVLQAVERELGLGVRVVALPGVKFTAPLAPGQAVTITLAAEAPGGAVGQIAFTVRRPQGLIASGTMRYAVEPSGEREGSRRT